MRALCLGVSQAPCLPSRAYAPRAEIGRTLTAAPTSGRRFGSGQLWPASTFTRTGGRRNRVERGQTLVVKAASTSTLIFLSALPFAIVGLVWVGMSLVIGRIEYEYYEELQELEEIEAERQRLVEQGLAPEEPSIVGESSELSTTEEASDPVPVGAGRRNRPVREE